MYCLIVSSRLRTKRELQQQQHNAEEEASATASVPPVPVTVVTKESHKPSQILGEPSAEPVKRPRGRPRKIRPPEPQAEPPKAPEATFKQTRSLSRGTVDSARERTSPIVDVVGEGDKDLEAERDEVGGEYGLRRRDSKLCFSTNSICA